VNEELEPPRTDFPSLPVAPLNAEPGPADPAAYWTTPRRRPKFQHPYGRHILFFVLTLCTTTMAPAWMLLTAGYNPLLALNVATLVGGLWQSLPLLAILSAHEFGHYFACRYHDVDATLPYFIPAPVPLTGTLGAVIRIREAFPSRKALFDIGVAGPLAGFVMLVPFLLWGVSMSSVIATPQGASLYFGEPLLFKAVERLIFGVIPQGRDVLLHPMGVAAWWGMLATALNLLPFGQLDGGHIMYANVGRRATTLSMATLLVVVALTVQSLSWISMAVMMGAMAVFFGFRHPRVVDEHEPLDGPRRAVAVLAVIVFILCFTPAPINAGP
jgi:membrane-associated protease RseP (regulator of RpoE activity)